MQLRIALSAAALCLLGGTAAQPAAAAAPSGCALAPSSTRRLNEGATDHAYRLPPTGRLRAVMLFVDFPDAPATEQAADLYDLLVPPAVQWYGDVSYGRVSLDVTRIDTWYRMDRPSTAYGRRRGEDSFDNQRAYLAEAIAHADGDVDFSRYQIVYVVAAGSAANDYSPAFIGGQTGVPVDGTVIRYGVTFGSDIRRGLPSYAAFTLVHETAHTLGLPDLYDLASTSSYPDYLAKVGGWDPMSYLTPGAGFLAWHRLKLGWLDPSQIVCVAAPGQVRAELSPLEAPGGTKAVIVRTGAASFYVAEVRQRAGQDSRLCDQGVLVYTVNTSAETGKGPIQIKRAQSGSDQDKIYSCGPGYDAPFDLGPGEISTFEDASAQVKIELLRASGGSYALRVTYGRARAEPSGAAGRRRSRARATAPGDRPPPLRAAPPRPRTRARARAPRAA